VFCWIPFTTFVTVVLFFAGYFATEDREEKRGLREKIKIIRKPPSADALLMRGLEAHTTDFMECCFNV